MLFCHSLIVTFIEPGVRVAEVGSLSVRAEMAIKIFVKRIFTILVTNIACIICNINH